MRAIVTGSAGFVGQHLSKLLKEEGMEVIDFNLRAGQDIQNYEILRNNLDVYRPDYLFHLAGQAFVPESVTNPRRTFEINAMGAINVFEAVRQLGLKTKIQVAGSSEEYGDGDVGEESVLKPKSPYAVSKIAMDYLGMFYAKTYGMDIVVTRAFNHTGPGRGEMYAESAWAKQIVEIEQGKRKFLTHGSLETIRNYTDVRDMVRAYRLAIDLPSGEYNICSSVNITMEECLTMLCGVSKVKVKRQFDSSLGRPNDFSFKEPNCEKFHKLTGWETEIALLTTFGDLLDYWREKLK